MFDNARGLPPFPLGFEFGKCEGVNSFLLLAWLHWVGLGVAGCCTGENDGLFGVATGFEVGETVHF